MIKAIFFDLDGVLTTDKTGSVTISKHITSKTGLDYDLVLCIKEQYDEPLDDGRITYEEAWNEICNELGTTLDFVLVKESYITTPIDHKIIEFAKSLKSKFKVGIITDNMIDRTNFLWKHNSWDKIFDDMVVSASVGSRKNETKIFEIACERLNVSPNECIFIDNKESNLTACEELGMNGIYFDDKKRAYEELFAAVDSLIK